MTKKTLQLVPGIFFLLLALLVQVFPVSSVLAAGATSSVHIVKYANDNVTVVAEKTVSYQWMEDNLPIRGDGTTHYYQQGPTFDPDNLWDPNETVNLKDKGAVMGTSIKDLCDLVGAMESGDEVMLCAVDGWQIKFKYANVYEPEDRQGAIALCWYNGEDALEGERDMEKAIPATMGTAPPFRSSSWPRPRTLRANTSLAIPTCWLSCQPKRDTRISTATLRAFGRAQMAWQESGSTG